MATMKTHCEGINFEIIEWWKGREIREVSTSRKYFHIMEKVIDFLLEMMKVCLHNLITMSTIEQLLYISWTVVFKPTFKLQAILNKCQNKSLKHIVNYTLPPHRYVNKTCTECKKIAQKIFCKLESSQTSPLSSSRQVSILTGITLPKLSLHFHALIYGWNQDAICTSMNGYICGLWEGIFNHRQQGWWW